MLGGCGSCGGCGSAPKTGAPAVGVNYTTVAAAPGAAVAGAIPMTACKCGRLPWWWLLVAFVVGYSMKRAK